MEAERSWTGKGRRRRARGTRQSLGKLSLESGPGIVAMWWQPWDWLFSGKDKFGAMRYEGASKPRGSLKCKLTCAGGCRPRHGEANGICAAIFRGLVEATVPKALAAFSLKQSTSQEDSLEVLDSSCSNTRDQRISSTSRRTRSVS